MSKKGNIEVILESFENKNIVLDQEQQNWKERIIKVLDIKLKDIYITDYDLYKDLKNEYKTITFPQVCSDINIVERMIANEKNPNADPHKVFIRYFITEVTKKAMKIAEAKDDAYTMAYSANILGKHHLTDKEDNVKPNWDDIIPFIPEITSDPRVLGIEPIKDLDELRLKLEKKYGFNKAIDIDYKPVDNGREEDEEVLPE
jgi:hypothetical protein